MASKDRERQLAREHYERQLQRRAAARRRTRRRTQIIAAVLALALVLGGIVAIALSFSGGDKATAKPAATSPSPGVSPCPRPAPAAKASAPSFAAPADQKLPPTGTTTAAITTNCGAVTVALDDAHAPKTVNSFVFLARKGYFDQTPCHRVTTSGIYVLQCGDPTGAGNGGPGYTIPLENAPQDGVYPAGTLAMARTSAPDSGGSQFFIVYKESQLPAPGYAIFGKVTQGLDVVTGVAAAGSDGSNGAGDGAPRRAVGITAVQVGGAQ